MSLVCGQCSRVNPSEAAYCYHDGAALAGRAGGPINAGSAPFPNQFVFPNGLACRNFDQLASACQQNWSAAVDLLKQGFLGSFFGGMGRVDLAMAAQEAAKFPDIERGLDQLLAKLPTQALEAPKLQAEPSEINLGQIKVGENRTSELHLTNLGMRLLYGNVTSDCKWLTIGEGAGQSEKLVQFGSDAVLPVQIRGQHLRAGTKPLEGHLTIDSNGGMVTVTFRADVPITAYQGGLFDGAVTPRKIAEKSKANPKDAATYFEKGEVAAWYAANGWPYPVQGPIMSGMGSIQQFFEALGVAKAPKVEFTPTALDLQAKVGKKLESEIEVTTPERKVVYGWATCDQPWVEVGTTRLSGKSATIPITIRVPDPCPPTLTATLHLFGNGQQKLDVPIKVKVAGGKSGIVLEPKEEVLDVVDVVEETASANGASVAPAPTPFAFTEASAPPPSVEAALFAIDEPATGPGSGSGIRIPKPPPSMSMPLRIGIHFAPLVVLFFCLIIPLVHDIFSSPASNKAVEEDDRDVDKRPFVKLIFDEGPRSKDVADTMNFAVHKLNLDRPGESVKLNWYENGFGNSIVAKIDGTDYGFGFVPDHGRWASGFEKGKDAGKYGGKIRTFQFRSGIHVTQTVTIVPSDPVEEANGDFKRRLDTCFARYKIENKDTRKHMVGLRILMDTCIGDKDDVPFTLPGVREVVSTAKELTDKDVPDFVQILEKPSLRDPGIVVQLGLRVGDPSKLEPPNRFRLTRYPAPGRPDPFILNKWDVPLADMKDDSSVVMYWDAKEMPSGAVREMAFTYGLGRVEGDGKLAITVGGPMYAGSELSVVALVADPAAKTATLKLPQGFTLLEGQTLEQKVTPMRAGRPSPITWRVHVGAGAGGKNDISVSLDTGVSKKRTVSISAKSLFN